MEHTRNQPILLIAAGPGAVRTVAEVPHAARDLCVRVAGPFGLLVAGGPAGRIRMSSCFWLSEMTVPETSGPMNVVGSGSDETLFKDLCSLVRRLQVGEEGPAGGGRGRTHIHAYMVIDLATPDIVPVTVQLARLLRRACPSIEMTGLTLTGRTAETGTSTESAWYESFGALLTTLEKAHLLQRLYILDGEDTNGTWLRDLEQAYRIGAEFILHHGMSPYRHSLRRREKTRTSLDEPFLEFCGSAMCKRFRWDASVVAREVAATLARDTTVQELDEGALSRERSEALDRLAQRLVEDIVNAYENEEPPSDEVASAAGPDPAMASPPPTEKARAAVERTLMEVCSTQPTLSLRWFFKELHPRLRGLTTFGRLRARWEARFRAAQTLGRKMEDVYAPMKEWQRLSGVEWRAPTEPFIAQPPPVLVASPVPLGHYVLAVVLAAVGLAMIALGGWRQQEAAMIAGGIVAIWAGLLTVLSIKWVECPRALVRHDTEPSEPPPVCTYHKWMPPVRMVSSLVLLILGAGCLGLAILAGWRSQSRDMIPLYGGLAVAGALVAGVLIYLSTTTVSRPRKAPGEEEIPDLALPWDRRWYVAGLIVLTIVWTSLCLGSDMAGGTPNTVGLLAGLGALWLGLVLAQLPRRGTAQLTCTIPRMPQRPTDLDEKTPEGPRVAAHVESLQSWADRLLAIAESSPSGGLDWGETGLTDLFPKMFTPQWRYQLAKAFRKNQELRLGKPLRRMVDDPEAWTRCLMEGLTASGFDLANPLEAFWRYYVNRWLEHESLEHLVSQLELDSQTVVSAILATVPPRWPQTRANCDVDTSAIAMGKELWSVMAHFADPDDPHRFAVIDWQDRHTVAVIRIVQGLSRGWRGFSALPSQQESTRAENEQALHVT